MKVKDLREKSVDELKLELLALLREQFNLRMQKASGQAPKSFKKKKLIAQIKTVLLEKGLRI